ncbi:MAG: Rpn family recombination-promoting nuclease/putative transposase, partial [Bacteroidota bacterium]
DLNYIRSERLGATELDRKAIFDLYCINDRGERFIVELQKTKQTFFKDRTVFYSTFPIQEQAEKTPWNYELQAIYTVAILDFVFDTKVEDPGRYRHDVKLMETQTGSVFYDKLTFIYLEMPRFNKPLEKLTTRFEKWLYVLRNLNRLDQIPVTLKERIFEKLFQTAEIAQFTPDQMNAYQESLKHYRDLKNSLDTAKEEGIEEGMEKGREEALSKAVKGLIEAGAPDEMIMKGIGITRDRLEELKKDL